MEVRGLLVVPSHVSPELELEYNAWYDREHIPERQAIQGFLTWRRFQCLHGQEPKYLAFYDLASPDVLETQEYKWLRAGGRTKWALSMLERIGPLTRHICRAVDVVDSDSLLNTRHVRALIGQAAPGHERAFADWFDREHAPAMRSVTGVRMVRRFETVTEPHAVIALYDLADPAVCETRDWVQAAAESGSWRISQHLTRSVNKVYEQIYP